MSNQYIITNIDQGVLNVTINRPEKLNALNIQVLTELMSVISNEAASSEVRCVVITGAGDKAFVAGADIAELRGLSPEGLQSNAALGKSLMSAIENLGKPVIAAVNGFALGGGCELAMACHLRIASSSALLGLPEVQLGLMPGYGGTQRLLRLVGQGRSLEMMLSGKPVNAQKALEYGLVNQVVEPDELVSFTGALASKLARSAPCAMKSILEAVVGGADVSLEQGLTLENRLFEGLFETDDMREGTSAFLEKRKPEFKGR